MEVVVDTSVLVDMLFHHRPRHSQAVRLARRLADQDRLVLIPMHAVFEIVSAASIERKTNGQALRLGELGESMPFAHKFLPIDDSFAKEHVNDLSAQGTFIDLKSGDMIFVAVAFKRKIALVTEDQKMLAVARDVGVRAFSIEEYLAAG